MVSETNKDENMENKSVEIQESIGFGIAGESKELSICSRMVAEFDNCDLVKTKDGRIMLKIQDDIGTTTMVEMHDETMLESVEKIILNIQLAREHGEFRVTTDNDQLFEYSNQSDGRKEDETYYSNLQRTVEDLCEKIGINDPSLKTEVFSYFCDYMDSRVDLENAFDRSLKDVCLDNDIVIDIEDNKREELKEYFDRIREMSNHRGKCRVCDERQILLDGEPLVDTENAREELIKEAVVDGEKDLVDLRKYPNSVQESLMKELFSTKDLELDEKDIQALRYYKGEGFSVINSFMRGDFSRVQEENGLSIRDYTDIVLRINRIAKSLPERQYDIVLSRLGTGRHQEHRYDSFVSFGTNDGTAMGGEEPSVRYIRVLGKDEPSVPIELLCGDVVLTHLSECEVTLLPFEYEEQNESLEKTDNLDLIEMVNEKQLSVEEILMMRLQQLKTERGDSEDINDAIELVNESIDKGGTKSDINPNSREIISQVVENPNRDKQPRLSAIRSIAGRVRSGLDTFLGKNKEQEEERNSHD